MIFLDLGLRDVYKNVVLFNINKENISNSNTEIYLHDSY